MRGGCAFFENICYIYYLKGKNRLEVAAPAKNNLGRW
jgi:hypothetical protein